MLLNRIELVWSGPQVVGGGITQLYSRATTGAPDVGAILSAFVTAKNVFPAGVTVTVPGAGDVIEDTTGTLTDVWSASGGGVMTATGDALCAAGVGACVSWSTGGIVAGRRLRGRTFLVPLTGVAYASSGQISPTYVGWLQTLANSVLASNPLHVWHRPTTKGGSDGTSYAISSGVVRGKVAMLKSRRD